MENPTENIPSKFLRPTVLKLLEYQVRNLQKNKSYRPKTNLFIVHRNQVLQSKFKESQENSFFGGGIEDQDPDIETAILRELKEETGITEESIESIEYAGQNKADFRESQRNRDGYTNGQNYFYFTVRLKPDFDRSKIQTENDYQAVWSASVKNALNTIRHERIAKIINVLTRI